MSEKRQLTSAERKKLEKQRKNAVKQAKNYKKEQKKTAKKSSPNINEKKGKMPSGEIEQKLYEKTRVSSSILSREEKFRIQSRERLKMLEPQDFDDGYYVDEFSEKQKQERRAQEIRKQENEVIRRPKKPRTPKQIRRRSILLYSAVFAIVFIIGIALSLTVLFKTENIIVEGDNYYYDEQITEFCGVELQQNIFIATLNSTPDKVSENLPYVESAKVTFTIPDTITIKVKNAVPSYVIKSGDMFLFISEKGRIIDRGTENTKNLPLLTCDELKSTDIGDYVSFSDQNVPAILEEITKSLKENNVDNVTGINVKNTANIKFTYNGKLTVNLGLPENLDYKICTANTIITEKLDPNGTGEISGTLDVSECVETKTSRYKPEETQRSTEDATFGEDVTAETTEATAESEPTVYG